MYVKLRNCILTVLLGMFSSIVWAQSDFPVFAYDLYGKWGYCYQGTHFVLPCYDNVVDLGPSCAVFWAQQDSLWGLRRADNSEIIPFAFDDVCVASQYQPMSYPIKLDSIKMFDQGVIFPAITLERDYRYRAPQNVNPFFPLLPVKKNGKWGYVDFKGETRIPFEYDEAFLFTKWLGGDKKRENWLAEVRKDGKSAWINVFGHMIIFWQQNRTFSSRELKKLLKKKDHIETIVYGGEFTSLTNRMDSALVIGNYVHRQDLDIKVVEVKLPKKSKGVKPRYRVLYADNTPVVKDTFDFVFPREGDAIRVKKANMMQVINLNTGRLSVPAYDSIAPFNEKGEAQAWFGKDERRIGLRGTLSYPNDSYRRYLAEIQSAVRKRDWKEAAKIVNDFSVLLSYYESPWYRVACDATLRNVAENYNYYNDPKLIAERERIKAEKQAQKKESGWSILGDILSTAGSFSNSETSQSLKALGESIKAVANPDGTASETAESSASSEAQAAEAVAETSAAKPDVSKLQAEISAIDRNLEQVSAQQIELAQKRLKAKGQVTTAGALAVKVPTGANAARNFSPSRIRQQSKLVAEAQRPARNSVSSIDTQLQQLNERKAALLTRRKQLSDQINQLMNNSADNAEGQSSSSGKPAKQKQTVNLSIYRSSQEHLNSIGRQLSDLYTKYKDETQTFTSSDRSKVKSLQAEARKVRKNCLDQTGQTLPANSLESWNP